MPIATLPDVGHHAINSVAHPTIPKKPNDNPTTTYRIIKSCEEKGEESHDVI
jgi:hypothetical protein